LRDSIIGLVGFFANIMNSWYSLQKAPSPLDGGASSGDSAIDDPLAGYLYHPRRFQAPERNTVSPFDNSVPYVISLSQDGKQLTLSYQLPGLVSTAKQTIRKTVSLVR
jgi:hypothetical protein